MNEVEYDEGTSSQRQLNNISVIILGHRGERSSENSRCVGGNKT